MTKIDLHNHTTLCNHANGSPEEFVLQAINQNIDYFGFSDHAPMDFDKRYRMSFSNMQEYEQDIKKLRQI